MRHQSVVSVKAEFCSDINAKGTNSAPSKWTSMPHMVLVFY